MGSVSTLIVVLVACVVLYRLFTILGTKTGNEEQHIRERNQGQREREDRLARRAKKKNKESSHALSDKPVLEAEDVQVSVADSDRASSMGPILGPILERDPDFDPDGFLAGARGAYEMALSAFSSGNKKELKTLLDDEVYEDFVRVIDEREAEGHTAESEFIGFHKYEIRDAYVEDDTAHVQVYFCADLVSAIRDSNKEVIEGDPNRIQRVHELWTFMRPFGARGSNWHLCATESLTEEPKEADEA